jgi:hypothetical protein
VVVLGWLDWPPGGAGGGQTWVVSTFAFQVQGCCGGRVAQSTDATLLRLLFSHQHPKIQQTSPLPTGQYICCFSSARAAALPITANAAIKRAAVECLIEFPRIVFLPNPPA